MSPVAPRRVLPRPRGSGRNTLGVLVPPRGITCGMHEYLLMDHVYQLLRYYKIPVFSDSIYAPVVGGLRCSVSEKNYPCPLVCVVLLRHTPLPFDRYLGPILLLLALFLLTLTWFFSMCRPCDHLCVGRKGSPQATIGPFSGSAFVALSCGQTKNRIILNITTLVVCSWAASPAPTSTPPPTCASR